MAKYIAVMKGDPWVVESKKHLFGASFVKGDYVYNSYTKNWWVCRRTPSDPKDVVFGHVDKENVPIKYKMLASVLHQCEELYYSEPYNLKDSK